MEKMKDVDKHTRKRLVFAWKCGILGFFFSCALDWDHIWYFVLKVQDPINLTGIQGRPFHTVIVFLVYAVVVSIGIVAFKIRQHDINS